MVLVIPDKDLLLQIIKNDTSRKKNDLVDQIIDISDELCKKYGSLIDKYQMSPSKVHQMFINKEPRYKELAEKYLSLKEK